MNSRIRLIATAMAAVIPFGASAARAEPPIKIPAAGHVTVVIPAEMTPCGAFTLEVNDGSKGRIFTRPDGTTLAHFAGKITGVLTSVATRRSITLKFSGPVWLSAAGSTLTGGSLLWNPEVLASVQGRVFVPVDEATDWQITGHRTNLCPLLVPGN